MRELQMLTGDLSKTFEDISELASGCKYKNCAHRNEPGCAIRQAKKNAIMQLNMLVEQEKLLSSDLKTPVRSFVFSSVMNDSR